MQVLDVGVSPGHSGLEVQFLFVLSSSNSVNHSVSVDVSLYVVQCDVYMLLLDCLCVFVSDWVLGWILLWVVGGSCMFVSD